MKDDLEYITIKFVSFKALVKAFAKNLFEKDPDADRATHPLEMSFLDHMIELEYNHEKKMNNKTNNIICAVLGCALIGVISYNSVKTRIEVHEVVEIETEVIEVIKEVPVEVVRYISECTSFDEAFKTHRELLGKHETFFWNGQEYNLYHKEEIKWEH